MTDIRIVLPDQNGISDPYDLDALRVSQDFDALAGVQKIITAVPVRKPGKQSFVRVRAGAEWRLDTMLLELKEDRELYLVAPAMRAELADEIVLSTLHTAIDRQGNLFLWPVRLPDSSGRDNPYWISARSAVAHAETHWVRVVANQISGTYDVYRAVNESAYPPPEWPALTFQEILRLAFKNQMINSPEHVVYKRLRGLA